MTLPILTDRLHIRECQPSDAGPMFDMVSDPQVMRFINDGSTRTLDMAMAQIDHFIHSQREMGYSWWAVTHKQPDLGSGPVLGFCGLGYLDDPVDFGWRFLPTYHGKGYATEAAAAVFSYGKETLKLAEIGAYAYPENFASIRVMEKIGLAYLGQDMFMGKPVMQYGWQP